MNNVILSATDAKQARMVLQLSQGKVAGHLGVNRTYLSQFENGRYLFNDALLEKLRDYYEEEGYQFNDDALEPRNPAAPGMDEINAHQQHKGYHQKTIDGFVIPDSLDFSEADAILSEYAENGRRIAEICNSSPKSGLLFGLDEEDLEERMREALVLMARNYALIEQLHGHATVFPVDKEEKSTVGDYLGASFAKQFNGLDEKAA